MGARGAGEGAKEGVSRCSLTTSCSIAAHHLVGKEQHSLERELAVAEIEEVLEGWTKEVDDHGVVVAFLAVPSDKGDTDAACERLVDFCLVLELRVLSLDRLELDGYLFARDDINAEVDVAEGPRANLLADAVLQREGGRGE